MTRRVALVLLMLAGSLAGCRTLRGLFAPPRPPVPDLGVARRPAELPPEIVALQAAAAARPDDFDVRFALGYRLLRLAIGGYVELAHDAARELEAAVRLRPDHAQALFDLQNAHLLLAVDGDEAAGRRCAAAFDVADQLPASEYAEMTRMSAVACRVGVAGLENDAGELRAQLLALDRALGRAAAFPDPLTQDGAAVLAGPLYAELPERYFPGSRARALQYFERMMRASTEGGFADPGFEPVAPGFKVGALFTWAELLRLDGQRDRAQERYEEVLRLADGRASSRAGKLYTAWAQRGLALLEHPDPKDDGVPLTTRGAVHCLYCHLKDEAELAAPATGRNTPPVPEWARGHAAR